MHCTVAKIFWEQTKTMTGVKLPSLHPDTWARDLLLWGKDEDRAIIICGMWALWWLRNKRRHGEATLSIKQAVLWVRDMASDLWEILHRQRQTQKVKEASRWKPPSAGWIKCNQVESGLGASGGVLRNSNLVFLGAQARTYDHCLNALMVEAWARRDGLRLAIAHGVRSLCLEADSLELVRLWDLKETQRSALSPVLMEMHELCLQLSEFELRHTSRACNNVAHELAKRVVGESGMVQWYSEAPPSI